MASAAPRRPISLAQSFDETNLDGNITWDEAITNTDGMKVVGLERPMVVNKPVGFVKVGDLPARDEIDDGIKKKIQFLDVLLEYEGAIDLKEVETMFLQQRYEDLPPPIKVPGNNVTPFTMQLVVLPLAEGKWNIVKHIRFADGAKVMHNTIKSMSVGRALKIDYQKNFKDGSRALQYLLEGMGGFQVRYQKLVPANSNTKLVRETEDIRKSLPVHPRERPAGQLHGPVHQLDRRGGKQPQRRPLSVG